LAEPGDPDGPWIHRESGLCFARVLLGTRADKVFRYDEAGRNVSVRYAAPSGIVLSAFVYPRTSVRGPFAACVVEAANDMLSKLDLPRAGRTFDVAFARAGAEPVRGHRVEARASGRGGGAPALTHVLELFDLGPWLVKLRTTHTERQAARVEALHVEWLRICATLSHGAPRA